MSLTLYPKRVKLTYSKSDSTVADDVDLVNQRDLQLQDQVIALCRREDSYLSSTSPNAHRPLVQHSEWRSSIFLWFYRIIDHLQYDRKVIAVAIDYLDRFLLLHPSSENMQSWQYQLIAMTCLYVAMKLYAHDSVDITKLTYSGSSCIDQPHEPLRSKRLHLNSYVELSRGQFISQDILDMEITIYTTLHWNLNPVTPMCFIGPLLGIFPQYEYEGAPSPVSTLSIPDGVGNSQKKDGMIQVLYEVTRYLTELAICAPNLSLHLNFDSQDALCRQAATPSVIAYSSLLMAMSYLNYSILPKQVRDSFITKCAKLSPTLHPNRIEVRNMTKLIEECFVPDLILDSSLSGRVHPISAAKEAGWFCETFLQQLSPSTVDSMEDTL